jgi:hypothetical protein
VQLAAALEIHAADPSSTIPTAIPERQAPIEPHHRLRGAAEWRRCRPRWRGSPQ